MLYPVTILDNFFEEPDKIVDLALNTEYSEITDGRWPGVRSKNISQIIQTERKNTPFVYGKNMQKLNVIKDGKAWRRNISLGQAVADRFVITSGLEDGETVATKGNEKLKPGKKIKIVEK